jgi:hypothetical protein
MKRQHRGGGAVSRRSPGARFPFCRHVLEGRRVEVSTPPIEGGSRRLASDMMNAET